MAPANRPKPSFSRGRKWSIGLNVMLTVLAVLAVLVMANYLSGRHFQRFYLSTRARVELSTRTISILHNLTNRVQITLYYTKDAPFYSDIADLLKEYHDKNPRLTLRLVDYERDPGAAAELKARYHLGAATNKNLVIFDCAGRTKFVNGQALVQYQLEEVPDATEREFRRKPVAFLGEMMFTSALLGVINPTPLTACFLGGHGEHRPGDTDPLMGYSKFAGVLQTNYIQVTSLSLLGTNNVPDDCNLLVIAGPQDRIPQSELDKIEQYLNEGGRLLAMFDVYSVGQETGLEKILAKWGVDVSNSIVKDPQYTTTAERTDVIVSRFGRNPVVNPLVGSAIQLLLPREVSALTLPPDAANGLKVEEIAFSGPRSYLQDGGLLQKPHSLPLMVAVEKNPPRGVPNERGATRILVVGDSLFLGNRQIESGANRDFAGCAANWLLDRPLLLEGLGPKPISEYRVLLAKTQMQTVRWLLLGAMPGAVLLLGGLVWLRRRT